MGMQIALMLAGAVLTETTFEWKGLGFMLSQYLKGTRLRGRAGHRYPNRHHRGRRQLIVDVIAALVDPRVRY